MKFKRTGANTLEVHMEGIILLISYDTPVAWYDSTCKICWVTTKKWSVTTSKHINKFVNHYSESYFEADQSELDSLYKNVREGLTPQEFMIKSIPVHSREDDLII